MSKDPRFDAACMSADHGQENINTVAWSGITWDEVATGQKAQELGNETAAEQKACLERYQGVED